MQSSIRPGRVGVFYFMIDKRLPFSSYDPQDTGPQYLEDLATAYWYSEALFTAVEAGIFTLIGSGEKTAGEIARELGLAPEGVARLLHALCTLGLLHHDGGRYYNTHLSSEYLVSGKKYYQGGSILWRKSLAGRWKNLRECLAAGGRTSYGPEQEEPAQLARRIREYIAAMDCVARAKAREILPVFSGALEKGEILDAGAGSGAIAVGFLERFPSLKATLMDIPGVLNHTRELIDSQDGNENERIAYCAANVLDPWPFNARRFDLVVLSNIIHAYSEKELRHILANAAACVKDDGFILIHDFFLEHRPEKAALFDLNMLINTYNGKVFSQTVVTEELSRLGLCATCPVPLGTDTAIIIAAKDERALAQLHIDSGAVLVSRIRALGFRHVRPIPADAVHIPAWPDLRCKFGCERYGSPHCPPNSPSPEKTREVLKDYSSAILLEGEPPGKEFQLRVLKAEKEAFTLGFHKTFAFWAGPCSLCPACPNDGKCYNTRDSRPSMEGAGIDVFETVRRAGFRLRTLDNRNDFVKYYALILLE